MRFGLEVDIHHCGSYRHMEPHTEARCVGNARGILVLRPGGMTGEMGDVHRSDEFRAFNRSTDSIRYKKIRLAPHPGGKLCKELPGEVGGVV